MKNNQLGITYMLISLLAFSAMHVAVKFLHHVPVSELILFRSVFSLIVCWFTLQQLKINPWGNDKRGLILRGLLGVSSLALFFYSLKLLPIATAVIIGNLVPFFTLLLAMTFLKEKIPAYRWVLLLISLAGVICIKGLDSSISWLGITCAVLGALGTASAHFTVGWLKKSEHVQVVMFYFPLVTLPIVLPFALYEWVTPVGTDWIWVIIVMIGTHIGQLFLTKAYHHADVESLSPTYFVGILLSIFYGYWIFNEPLTYGQWIGSLIIIACLYGHHRWSSLRKN